MSYEFPTTPKPAYPVDISANWKNILTPFDSGAEQTRQKNLYPKYDVTLVYKTLSLTNIQILWNFYNARRGSFEPFYFYTPESASWTGVWVGMGDTSTTIFNLSGKSTSAHVIYANGAVVTASDYTINTGGGDASSDRVTFDTAPAVNVLLTADFTGFLRIRCRFKNDKMTRSLFTTVLYTTGIELKGVANI